MHFLKMMDNVRWEDYDIEYWSTNMFEFMGNGFELREFDGRDITNYLGCLDEHGRDVQPVYDERLMDIMGGSTLDESHMVR